MLVLWPQDCTVLAPLFVQQPLSIVADRLRKRRHNEAVAANAVNASAQGHTGTALVIIVSMRFCVARC
jgi:hypothetical protein